MICRMPAESGAPPDEMRTTTYLPDATETEAFRQGWWAQRFGQSDELNPYHPDLARLNAAWAAGYATGKCRDEG